MQEHQIQAKRHTGQNHKADHCQPGKQIVEEIPPAEIKQDDPIYDAVDQHRGKHQSLGFEQHTNTEHDVGGGHFVLCQKPAHEQHGQRKHGIHLSPDGRVQDDSRVQKIKPCQHDNLLRGQFFGCNLVKEQGANIKITTPEDFYYLKAILELEENKYIFGL